MTCKVRFQCHCLNAIKLQCLVNYWLLEVDFNINAYNQPRGRNVTMMFKVRGQGHCVNAIKLQHLTNYWL